MLATVLLVSAAREVAAEEQPSAVSVEQSRIELARLQARERELLERFTENHPLVVSVRAEIKEIQQRLKDSPPGSPASPPGEANLGPPPTLPAPHEELPTPQRVVPLDVAPSKPTPAPRPAEAPLAGNPPVAREAVKAPPAASQESGIRGQEPGPRNAAAAPQPVARFLPPLPEVSTQTIVVGGSAAGLLVLAFVAIRWLRRNRMLQTIGQLRRLLRLPVVGPIPYENPQSA